MHFDADLVAGTLNPIVSHLTGYAGLTPAERAEVVRIAQGYACKDSAAAANISPETIRARRKRLYRKLDVSGASDLLAELLARSLATLARNASTENAGSETVETQIGAGGT